MILLIENVKEQDNTYKVLFCRMCNVGFTVPFPSQTDLSSLYSAGTYRSVNGKRFIAMVETGIYLARILRKKRIENYIGKGRILDIGCGRGTFLNIMKQNGWTVAGTEYDQIAAGSIAKKYNLHVVSGNPKDWRFLPGSFEVVTMNHVVEHMTDPERAIDECSRLLIKGGLLVVAVPNIKSLQSVFGKHHWFHLDIPHHLFHFSEEGLLRLLEKYNFRLLKVRRFDLEHNPFGWLQTLLNITGIRKNFLYNTLKNSPSRNRSLSSGSKRNLLATIFLIPFYFPIALLLSLFESYVLKMGGTVEIYAAKS